MDDEEDGDKGNLSNQEDERSSYDLVSPMDLAEYLGEIYKAPDTRQAQKLEAAVGLIHFWAGTELNRISDMLEKIDIFAASTPMGVPLPKKRMN